MSSDGFYKQGYGSDRETIIERYEAYGQRVCVQSRFKMLSFDIAQRCVAEKFGTMSHEPRGQRRNVLAMVNEIINLHVHGFDEEVREAEAASVQRNTATPPGVVKR